MIIGVMSDTHGNLPLMLSVADVAVRIYHADRFFHLGDDFSDAEVLRDAGYNVTAVPGLWCSEYYHPHIPKRIVEDIDGLTLVAVHAPKDLLPQDYEADLILTGHTHRAKIEWMGKALHVNPGHLKVNDRTGVPPSFAIVRIVPHEIGASLYDLDGTTWKEIHVERIRHA
ncbi:MAG TPA: metallophosphoesterase family protein [Candidatus Hydrogenedentes bacterium]|nr:metallophosphoesterase family protein [Candidatus Hydrogenedentota bacterium]HOL77307.1 metallophosphoesterase family protein [Candidatus Hydrogenedentota bacterium]